MFPQRGVPGDTVRVYGRVRRPLERARIGISIGKRRVESAMEGLRPAEMLSLDDIKIDGDVTVEVLGHE